MVDFMDSKCLDPWGYGASSGGVSHDCTLSNRGYYLGQILRNYRISIVVRSNRLDRLTVAWVRLSQCFDLYPVSSDNLGYKGISNRPLL